MALEKEAAAVIAATGGGQGKWIVPPLTVFLKWNNVALKDIEGGKLEMMKK